MSADERKEQIREHDYTNQTIEEQTGTPLNTGQKLFSVADSSTRKNIIREEQAAYDLHPSFPSPGQVGPYRLKDYLALPDEPRVELIDGCFYDMAAPHGLHQAVCGFLYARLLDFVTRNRGKCYPFISPFDVQLDADDKTVVQPDVFVICDRDKFQNGRIFGAPDLVIEVLSPSTRRKDMFLKLMKYQNAGVREYWIVDIKKQVIIQYDLQEEYSISVYGFEAEIPVLIWDGKCRINLREMTDSISFMLERHKTGHETGHETGDGSLPHSVKLD